MVIIKLNGGLGNQMFQYALYQAFKEKGVQVKLDRAKYNHFDEKRECFLDYSCFDLKYDLCSKKEARQYVFGTGILARALIRFFGDKKTHYFEKSEYEYDSDVLSLLDGYLDGFWQSWKYTKSIQEKIKECFVFTCELPEKAKKYEQIIKQTNSVAVHIRRGDYLSLTNIYGNICTEDYYRRAITKINQLVENPTFIFFSDDMEWTKEHFGQSDNHVFVEGKGAWEDYHDMQLMSGCRHHIMANSSFSWWAAYLNTNPGKKIICPSKWINAKDTPDVYCEDWIKL